MKMSDVITALAAAWAAQADADAATALAEACWAKAREAETKADLNKLHSLITE